MTIPPLPCACSDVVSLGLKGCTPPPPLPSLHCRLLIGSQVVEFVGVSLPISIVLLIGMPKDVDVHHFSKQNCWYCLIPPLVGVIPALFPPLLAWYKLYFPLVGVVPVHFRNLCKLTGQANAVAEVWVHLLPDLVGIGAANGNRHRCNGANPCQMAGGGL